MFDDIRLKNRCLAFNDQQDSFRFLQFTLQTLLRLPSGLVRFPWACGSQGSHPRGRQQKQLKTSGWGECMLHLGSLIARFRFSFPSSSKRGVSRRISAQHVTVMFISNVASTLPFCPVMSISPLYPLCNGTTHKLIHNGSDVPTFIQLPSAANL